MYDPWRDIQVYPDKQSVIKPVTSFMFRHIDVKVTRVYIKKVEKILLKYWITLYSGFNPYKVDTLKSWNDHIIQKNFYPIAKESIECDWDLLVKN